MRILKNTLYEAFLLGVLSALISGLRISGGLPTLLWGGLILSLLSWIVKPLVNLVTIPLALVSLGLSRILTNALILFLLTFIVPAIRITPFVFHRYELWGFVIPMFVFNYFFAFVVIACLKSLLQFFIQWVAE